MAINKKGDESKALKCEYSLPKVAMIKKGMFDGGIQRTASSMYGSANVTMGPSFFYSPELTPESWLLPKSRQEVCFVESSVVYTDWTIKNIEDIVANESVLCSRGDAAKVGETYVRKYDGDIITIKPYLLPELSVTGNHPIFAIKASSCSWNTGTKMVCKPNCRVQKQGCLKNYKSYSADWHDARNLQSKDFVAFPKYKIIENFKIDLSAYITTGSVIEKCYDLQTDKIIIRNVNNVLNRNIPYSKNLFRLLGWYMAEGSCGNGINFSLHEDETTEASFIIKTIKDIFGLDCTLIHKTTSKCICIFCSNLILQRFFTEQFKAGAGHKNIPEFVMKASPEYIREFLLGWIAGDGYNNEKDHYVALSTSSKTAMYQCLLLCSKLGFLPAINNNDKKGDAKIINKKATKANFNSYHIRIRNEGLQILGINNTQKRPHNSIYYQDSSYFYIPIDKITSEKRVCTVYNFSTENATYVAPIVVHNCKWVKIFYNLEPLVGSITDMHAKYPFSTFKFHCNDKRALEIFNDAFFNLDFNWVQFIYQMSLSYHKYGEAICWGNWNNANKRWDSFICIEPDLMDIKEDPFTGVKSYELIPTIEIKNMVKNSLLKGHTENLPEVLIDSIVNNNKIPLDGDGIPFNNKEGAPYEPPKIFTIARITDPGSTRGTSPIQRLFKCFTGDTKIFLLDGTIQTLESLYKANKEDFWVYSVDDKNNIIPAKAERVIYAGEESVIEVTLDNGEKIECTGDHKFILRDGRECSAQDLKPDMALMPLYKTFLPLGQYGTRRSKYEKIYNPSSGKWEWTHVKVALSENREQFKLRGSRVIHHVDFDSHNNTPENLQVISRDEHAKIHTVSFVSRERMREISKLGLIARNKDDKQSKRMKELWGNFQYKYKVSEKQRQRYANMSVEAKKHLSNNIREGQKDYLNNKYSIIIEKTKKITAELFIKYNRLPTYTEVSRELNVCPITVYNLIRRFGTAPLGIEPIKTRKEYLNHKVVAIRNLNKKAPVYCLGNVGKYHNFAIATDNNSGVFVKNCLIFQDKIRLAQIAIADRHHLPIELWTVGHLTGDPKTTILPDEATLNNIREMIRAATTTPPFCVDMDTRILTREGFKYHSQLKITDEIATLNPKTDEIEYQRPEAIHLFDYNGDMLHFKTNCIDHLVTPNHKCYVQKHVITSKRSIDGKKHGSYSPWELVPASEVKKESRFKTSGLYKGEDLSSINILDKNIDMTLWMQFVGWFVSEGSASISKSDKGASYIVNIAQSREEHISEIRDVFNKLPFKFHEYNQVFDSKFTTTTDYRGNVTLRDEPLIYHNDRIVWNIYNKDLVHYCREQFGVGAKNKKIPTWIKNLDKKYLQILLDTLLKGDGTISHKSAITPDFYYTTSSSMLKDDVLEIAWKCGYKATVTYCPDGMFRIHFSNSVKNKLDYAFMKKVPEKVSYNGKVWCVTVPNHLFVYERHGHVGITGNCIVYSPLLKYEALSVSGKLLSIYEDLGYVENQILIGMGVNKNLILSEGSAFTSSKTIALHRIIMEYQTVRDLFTETIRKNILLPIAIANDLRDANGRWIVPEIHWDKSLDPEKDKEEREFYLKLWEKGLCSTRTLYSKLPDDFIYEDEQRLLASEINTIFDKKDKRLPQMNLDPLSLAVTPDVSKQPSTGTGTSKPSTSTTSIAPIVPGMPPKTPTKPIEEPKKEEIKPELPKAPEAPVTPPPEKV